MSVPPSHAAAEPETLADVREHLPYRLRVAARLLGLHPDTVCGHARAWERAHPDLPRAILPKASRNSPVRLWGREVLRQAGTREIERSARTAEGTETERERERRAAAAVAAAMATLRAK